MLSRHLLMQPYCLIVAQAEIPERIDGDVRHERERTDPAQLAQRAHLLAEIRAFLCCPESFVRRGRELFPHVLTLFRLLGHVPPFLGHRERYAVLRFQPCEIDFVLVSDQRGLAQLVRAILPPREEMEPVIHVAGFAARVQNLARRLHLS